MSHENELKILQKCYDMIEYGYTALRQYPKSERYTLAADINPVVQSYLGLMKHANSYRLKKKILNDFVLKKQNQ